VIRGKFMMQAISEFVVDDDAIKFIWSDGRESLFHHFWLRDNCPMGRHPETWERMQDLLSIDPEIRPLSVSLASAGDLEIAWSDGHASRYAPDWLRRHCYAEASRLERRSKPVLWSGEQAATSPRATYDEIMDTDAGLLCFLETLRDVGFCIVGGMPDDAKAGERVAGRISYLRETNFGVDFTVVSKPNPNNNAYTALELLAHTDLPNREMPPGIQFLHCVAFEAEGGESIIVDGFRAAARLKKEDPEAFDLLSSVPMSFRFHDTDWDVRWRAPMIGLGVDGAVEEIRYNNALLSPMDVSAGLVKPLYRAIRSFVTILRDPESEFRFRMRAGDMLTFHNRRILHGRAAFGPNSGPRELHGCYVDIDEMMSRIRVLNGENLLA
jgi:gamma-butyrobetaine dioxygenase